MATIELTVVRLTKEAQQRGQWKIASGLHRTVECQDTKR